MGLDCGKLGFIVRIQLSRYLSFRLSPLRCEALEQFDWNSCFVKYDFVTLDLEFMLCGIGFLLY
jgi:hypothetical protein